uniref:Tyrosine-protein kinase n=1 Tax=Takifugu rubripes TaxID=31033 RepID=A0A674P4E6_TAKRU
MFPRVILKDTLIKKSQQKKRTSPCNYKERFFVLDTQDLRYSENRPGKKPTLKGCINLSKIKCVEIVCCDVPIPCNYKYPFQVFYDNHYLYIFAPDNECRQRWVQALKDETKDNNLVAKYHPNFWMDSKWRCCQQTEKLAAGCHVYDPLGFASKKPLPQLPDPKVNADSERIVIALQEYVPSRDTDLPLEKGHEYILINKSNIDWWTVRNSNGYGTFKLPTPRGKEGAFMVRDSSHMGVYTVSVFTKAPSGEKNPKVKHYQIRQTETGAGPFYLAENYLFNTIPELIHYHQHNAAGLITRLRHPVSPDGSSAQQVSAPFEDQWELNPDELTLGQEIGSGQFGLVLEGWWKKKKVAVKMIRDGCMSEDDLQEEARVMMKLSHHKLVQLYAVSSQRSPLCLVFEFMENGCLSDYLRARKGSLSQETLLNMCMDVSEGMAYLESSNFLHRDLAARNCLVSENNEVKVSDFGMTRFVLDDKYTSSQCSKFPVKWSAPEVIKYCKFSSKSDIWSFGVLMWEVYSEGRLPYDNRTNTEVLEALSTGLRLLKPRLAPDTVYLLMEWCWKEKPEDRPCFAVLLHDNGESIFISN